MRPWTTWIIFAFCLTVGLTVMGWLSATALRLDARAAEEQTTNEKVRLAMLRMESAIQLLLAHENSRPYFAYHENYDPASYLRSKTHADACWLPLTFKSNPYAQLYFQVDPEGHLTSPQVLDNGLNEEEYVRRRDELRNLVDPETTFWYELCPPTPAGALARAFGMARSDQKFQHADPRDSQLAHSPLQQKLMGNTLPSTEDVQQDPLTIDWVKDQLLLARRVNISGEVYFQGCLLDWKELKKGLLDDVLQLLPSAELEPAPSGDDPSNDRYRLVSLPARLVPGPLPRPQTVGMTALEGTLFLAWGSLILAAVAVAVVLHGVLTLSERRGAFVSAVTHELRTPLTTFRMYTEMLAEGMISEDKRRRYMERLRTEADRLGHLVENVLAYARLEQGRTRRPTEAIRLGDILDHARERLMQRAEQAGMGVVFDVNGQSDVQVRTDLAATEQVLFNLVDNACKYAAAATDKRIHVEAVAGQASTGLRVRDHGPGISREAQRRLFQPFSKSEIDAANSAPGVGLGLSLCRRLARDLGGDLIYEPQAQGAAFVLELPRQD